MKQRYHQIWRDAASPSLIDVRKDLYGIIQNLAKVATPEWDMAQKFPDKSFDDNNVIESYQLFDAQPLLSEEIEPHILISKDNNLRHALLHLVAFWNELDKIIQTYYKLELRELDDQTNIKANHSFTAQIFALCQKYDTRIMQELGYSRSEARVFKELQEFYGKLRHKCALNCI